MKNTAGLSRGRGAQPRRAIPAIQKRSLLLEDSPRLIIFVLHMYKQLTSEQRSQIFALLQRKCPRKEIARIVGTSQSTLSHELRRNNTRSGKYIWFKAHDKAMERRKRSTRNAALAPELVWRIKQLILEARRTMVTATNIERIEEGRRQCLTSMYLQHDSMPMQAGNWRATRVTSSNIGADPNASLFPLPIERAFTRVPSRRTENALGILRWI